MVRNMVHQIVDCPICGRPVEVGMKYRGREIACGHCRGAFEVHETPDCHLITRAHFWETLERADQSLSGEERPTVVLVEFRDEVFARLATDMASCGWRVVRATTAVEALARSVRYRPSLVVASLALPDQEGWLLAAKLRFVDPSIRVWLYQAALSSYERGLAEFLDVAALVDDGGDLLGLSEWIVDLLSRESRSGRPDAPARKRALRRAA